MGGILGTLAIVVVALFVGALVQLALGSDNFGREDDDK